MMGTDHAFGREELHSDPIVLELNRLHNQLKDKERELGAAHTEIKALRATESIKDKAIEELTGDVTHLDEKLRLNQSLLEQKNLAIKKLENEKREALAAQYAAEATLRRVHASQKDDDCVHIESVIAPLEADIKMYKSKVAALQEDKKALERLSKSKEVALVEAEKILRSALERALIVEEVQNHNFELKRQIEICQEENRILDKTYRQKVLEVGKLTQTIQELEEAVLTGGAAANTIRDYQRQISELNEEKKTLERELARVKVSANRVATVVANEWKDDNDKVMPVKQWLEERRLLQAETQRLRKQLAISERTAKAEAQLKDKVKLRLKTLEEGLKYVPGLSVNCNSFYGSPKSEKSSNIFGFLSTNASLKKRSKSQPRSSSISKSSPLQQPNVKNETLKRKNGSGENLLKKSLWISRSKVDDSGEKENKEMIENTIENLGNGSAESGETKTKDGGNEESHTAGGDMVSGFLYDRLQKELFILRKSCEVQENNLSAKDDEIKMLVKKIDTLTKALEVESKRWKREATIKEKEIISAKMGDEGKHRNTSSKRFAKTS